MNTQIHTPSSPQKQDFGRIDFLPLSEQSKLTKRSESREGKILKTKNTVTGDRHASQPSRNQTQDDTAIETLGPQVSTLQGANRKRFRSSENSAWNVSICCFDWLKELHCSISDCNFILDSKSQSPMPPELSGPATGKCMAPLSHQPVLFPTCCLLGRGPGRKAEVRTV